MKIQTPVKQETTKIAVGVAVLSVIMLLVFVAIDRFDIGVLYGALLGGGFAVFNFFLMAMTVQQAAEKMNGVRLPAEEEKPQDAEETPDNAQKPEELPQQKAARSLVQRSYMLRMLLTAAVIIAAIKVPVFNAIPAVIALFFPRIVITMQPIIQKIRKGA